MIDPTSPCGLRKAGPASSSATPRQAGSAQDKLLSHELGQIQG